MSKKKVLLGMSGGVDSSVAAVLLSEAGYDVTGVTLKLRPENELQCSTAGGCCSIDDVEDARRVAHRIGIEHLVFNFTDLFAHRVIDPFIEDYLHGRTPNPCIACNRHIKFHALLRRAMELGYDFVATGHYARICQSPAGRWLLERVSAAKDQSYVLYGMTQFQLAHTLFPLADYDKEQVRALAQEHGLSVAKKPDSQEICFVPNRDYAAFIQQRTGKTFVPGDFIDAETGAVLGRHKGIAHYTIGQRKGLGIAFGEPRYVTRIDAQTNQVVLGRQGGQYRRELLAEDVNFIAVEALDAPMAVTAKVRYQAQPAPAVLSPAGDGRVRVVFDEPQRSVTPGQAVVCYDGDRVVCGGTIS